MMTHNFYYVSKNTLILLTFFWSNKTFSVKKVV